MATKRKNRSSSPIKDRYIGKPTGQFQPRVQAVGPEHFGIVTVDCAKRRSKWMLCDFYGKVIIEPITVEHNAGALKALTDCIKASCRDADLRDLIVAVEMTGVFHRPVQRACRNAGFDTRTVHPFASQHFRRPLHPDNKSDDHDLEAIFHAAVKGYGLSLLPVSPVYQSLQATSRHRSKLVMQRSRLQVQIRCLLHQTMPGFADLFDEDKFFKKSIAIPVAEHFTSAAQIKVAGVEKICDYLRQMKLKYQAKTIERIVAWAATAADAAPVSELLTKQWQQLNAIRVLMCEQIATAEVEMAKYLVKTPYSLLLSVTGINVVSAAMFAGEAGPIEHYATARAINGRAGLCPSRYQSDEVDRSGGSVKRTANRRLRAASMMIATNLIKCHPYYRGLSSLMATTKVALLDRVCRIANRANRMIFQLVSGRHVWRGKGVDREIILMKLREFHRSHRTSLTDVIADLETAFEWLPKSCYAEEAKPLSEWARKRRRGAIPIGDLLLPLLIRLGVTTSSNKSEVESTTSEA